MEELKKIIEEQRKGHENKPMWMVGQQLLDMAAADPQKTLELLKQDLTVSGMGLKDAARALKAYADKHHRGNGGFCIPPHLSDKILRDFYKLPEMELEVRQMTPEQFRDEVPVKQMGTKVFNGLNLTDFL